MKYLFSVGLGFIFSFSSYGQKSALSLAEILSLSLEKNPSVKASRLETERQIALRGTSIDLPKTEVSLMMGQYNSIERGDNNLTVSQNIPFPTIFGKQSSLNKELVATSKVHEKMTRNDLAFKVTQVFNQLLYLKQRNNLLKKQDSLLRDVLRIADVQYRTGEGTLLSKISAETQMLENENFARRNEADMQIALNQLRSLSQTPELEDVVGNFESYSGDPVDATITETNPSLKYSAQQIEVAKKQKKVERARSLPDLTFGFFTQTLIGYQQISGGEQYFGRGKRFNGFQLGVSIPLWAGPHISRAKAASLTTEIREKENQALVLEVNQRYLQAVQELEQNKNTVEYYRMSALKTSALLVKQSRQSFQSGELDLSALLFNLRQALSIEEGYLSALRQFNESFITLEYLNGKY